MNTDYLTLDCTPVEEPCHGVGSNPPMERHEARAYKEQLERIILSNFPQEEVRVSLLIKKFRHEFGTYSEVAVEFDLDNEESAKQAYWLENNIPMTWDTKAIAYLEAVNYTKPQPQL